MHWFEEYREAYSQWWNSAAESLNGEALKAFTRFKKPDELKPLGKNEVSKIRKIFPHVQPEFVEFVERYGVGPVHSPDHYLNQYPTTIEFFGLAEMEARVESIREQAIYELETLEDEYDEEDIEGCQEILKPVIENPFQLLPIFGPSNLYNFFYMVQGSSRDGVVSIWYHDYHSCELLDGSGDIADFDAFGAELVRRATDGESLTL